MKDETKGKITGVLAIVFVAIPGAALIAFLYLVLLLETCAS